MFFKILIISDRLLQNPLKSYHSLKVFEVAPMHIDLTYDVIVGHFIQLFAINIGPTFKPRTTQDG